MILEANRMTAAWLRDADQGANAILARIPLDAGDQRPDALVLITNETNDGDVARNNLPATLPAVAVMVDHVADADGESGTITGDGKARLKIRVMVENPTTEDAVAALSYYLRAIAWSMRRFFLADPSTRVRNQIYLETASNIATQIATQKDQDGNAYLSGYWVGDVQMRDLFIP